MDDVPELLLIDKPAGITSMDVIRKLRNKLKIRKIGHSGTLDPLATGLMLVGVGIGTKKLTELVKLDKEYVAEVRLGESRTTGDLEGEIVAEVAVSDITKEQVETVLKEMVGMLKLPVSAYSAIKKAGVPMYKRARQAEKKGETVTDVPVREMKVIEAELLEVDNLIIYDKQRVVVKVRFLVGSGTYIRSLGEELGKRLGYPATLQALRRTKVGEYRIEDAQLL
jgi:tRNA pseudouridine55 synthase